MSGLEIAIPVISAIFALVSAFKDGGTIVEKIKDRRRRKGARLPDDRLQREFHEGADQIQKLRENGVQEFGDVFERDSATASRLKDVAIVLQDSIIRQLAAAHLDDTIDDFSPTIKTVIQARMQAINILNELYMTLQFQQVPDRQTLIEGPPQSRPLPRVQTIASEQITWEPAGGPMVSPVQESRPTSSSTSGRRPSVTGTRTGSWFTKRRRPSMAESLQEIHQPPMLSPGPSPGDQDLVQQRQQGRDPTVMLSPQLNSARSSSIYSSQTKRVSTNSSLMSPPQSPGELTRIAKTNKYAGFCEGAWYAQQMQLARCMKPSMKDYEWLYHCRKCKFKLQGDGSKKGELQWDDRIQVSSSGTVYFRLLFLWKSHIETKKHVRLYGCILCALSGGSSSVYEGEDRLFAHITRHEGTVFFDTQIIGPIEVGSEGITPATIGTFDFYIPQLQRYSSNTFMLPESAIPTENDQRMSSLLSDDPYENAWSNERSHAAELA